ncbi:MAG: NAD-dependent epimerase/dehydratase family protein [Neptuniibacter sp.]
MNILLTGGSGFIGNRTYEFLSKDSDISLTCLLRKNTSGITCQTSIVSGLEYPCDLSEALCDQQVVIHAAGLAHSSNLGRKELLSAMYEINVEGTRNLAMKAAELGVRRFIFISSIGVNGNCNSSPFCEEDEPNPIEPYAKSKLEAERSLWEIQSQTGMEVVIIRPPLVYGTNAPGNFSSLLSLVGKGMPLPLAGIKNKRSFVSIDNLVDLIHTCISHPKAANQVFLVGDGDDISTADFISKLAVASGKPIKLFYVPTSLLLAAGALLGKKDMVMKLVDSLQVDISKAHNVLDWTPPKSIDDSLASCFVSED